MLLMVKLLMVTDLPVACYLWLKFITVSVEGFSEQKRGVGYALAIVQSPKERMNLVSLHKRGLNGKGVWIVILDGGIDLGDPEFAGNRLLKQAYYIESPSSTFHGSACAAIACGVNMGIAPAANLLICQVSPDGVEFDTNAVVQALTQVTMYIQSKGLENVIISMSFGFEKASVKITQCIEALTSLGVVFVAAAGNAGRCQNVLAFPASNKNVLSVGACKPTGQPCDSNPEAPIDVYAPGEDIIIPSLTEPFSGSSAATPAVAGIIALILQCTNKLSGNLKNMIRDVNILRMMFQHDMKERGKELLAPHDLLESLWNDPNQIEAVIRKYCDD